MDCIIQVFITSVVGSWFFGHRRQLFASIGTKNRNNVTLTLSHLMEMTSDTSRTEILTMDSK